MRRFLINIATLMLICGIVYPILIFIWGTVSHPSLKGNINFKKGSYGNLDLRIEDADQQEQIDILFLGSSLCYRGFDTRIFQEHGYKGFNLGSSAQSHIQTNYILKRYLDRFQPKLVVYECSPMTMTSDGVESSLDVIANMPFHPEKFKFVKETENVIVLNTLLYGFFNSVTGVEPLIEIEQLTTADTYIPGGFIESEVQYGTYDSFKEKSPTTFKYKKNQLRAFEDNLALIKEAGAEIVLVRAPTTTSRYKNLSFNQSADSLFSSYGTFYNFNELMQLDDSLYYYDKTHLNQNGVELFNTQFIQTLTEAHSLPEPSLK